MTKTVLVVGDRLQRPIEPSLAAAGFETVLARNGAEALKLIATRAPDIVVLDLGLPDMEGKDVIRRVRAWSDVPIIVVSQRHRDAEEISALDLGADDYLGRPFSGGRLVAHIRAALRHRSGQEEEASVFSSGGLTLDSLAQTVTRNGVPIRLTAREFDVLRFLVRHAGHVVTHRQILQAVWGPANVEDTQYLRVFIGRLRQKIETDPADPQILTTVQGVGYRLAGSH
ncbi:MAG: winged helix-turn-helix domain-containing protein [Hyphomicrobiales bacterium]